MAGRRPEFCAVCGEQAIGFHYNVASCSGCRSFFRRSIKEEKVYVCKKGDGRCMLDKGEERVNCKSCRLDSAIEAGMNPKALQSMDIDIPSNRLAQMILLRQSTKRAAEVAVVRGSEDTRIRPSTSLTTVEERMQGLIDQLLVVKQAHDRIRCSVFAPTPFDRYNLDKAFDEPAQIGHQWTSMMEGDNRELIQARAPPVAILGGRLKWWHLTDCIYTLEYMKTFPFFEGLSRRDKRVLAIQVVSASSHLTRSFYSTEQMSEVTVNPDGMRHNESWKTVWDLEYDCEIIMRIYRLKLNEKEYALLKAIVVTDYDIIGLSDEGRSTLEQFQTAYRKSLLSIMMARRGPIEGPRIFSDALLMLSTLKKLTLLKKTESKPLYLPYRNTPFACPIIEEMLFEDPLLK